MLRGQEFYVTIVVGTRPHVTGIRGISNTRVMGNRGLYNKVLWGKEGYVTFVIWNRGICNIRNEDRRDM